MPLITFNPGGVVVNAKPGTLLLDAARAAGMNAETPCGGRGVCGKCLVRIESGNVDFKDTGMMPAGLVEKGYVLICRTKALDEPLVVRLMERLENEKGQFTKAGDDRLLIDAALLPARECLEPLVKKVGLIVSEPAMGDGLSDYDRLERAVKASLGAEAMELPLACIRELPDALRQNSREISLAYSLKQGTAHVAAVEPPELTEVNYGIAVDIGTTTVAVQLVDLITGETRDSKTAYNAQIECGLDVISRINYARKPAGLEELRLKALETINKLTNDLARECSINRDRILSASIAGNTTMTHLVLGILPEYIRLEPYTPAVYHVPPLRAADIGLDICPQALVWFAPSVGSYVGGDITSGLLCTNIPLQSEELWLFIDIGTNGELVIGNSEFMLGCACSAGPAFEGGGIDCGMRASDGAIEWVDVDAATGLPACSVIGGGKPAGICGSGMISLIASLFETGWLDAGGKFDRVRPSQAIVTEGRATRYRLFESDEAGSGRSIYVSETDIANIIRAKAAIFSACRVMLQKVGMDFKDLAGVYVAGGFGRYLDVGRASKIGLLPGLPAEKFHFIGNSSLTGAYMTLLSASHRAAEVEIAKKITYIDLGEEPEYMGEYTAALFLPHTDAGLFHK